MAAFQSFALCVLIAFGVIMSPTRAQLLPDFYEEVCPQALPIIKLTVLKALFREQRMGASLLRLHFHDCFVNGCDGSILLDDNATFTGEKTAFPNVNSVRGYEVIDEIKTAINNVCGPDVVSCADILAVAARDSVEILGGPSYFYPVLLGRRDARSASWNDANTNLPAPFLNFSQLLSNFQAHGLNLKDLVALSGDHTIGLARCIAFRPRIYNDTNIDSGFATYARRYCPVNGGGNNTQPLDWTPTRFDTVYYKSLLNSQGLLHSDQELFKGDGGESDRLVQLYSYNPFAFAKDFAASMIKMGNMKPLTGANGEIRLNCRRVN